MENTTLHTTDIFLAAVKKVAGEMNRDNVDEKQFGLPSTNLKFILVRKGTLSEENRANDPASLMGAEYEFDGSVFLLARR